MISFKTASCPIESCRTRIQPLFAKNFKFSSLNIQTFGLKEEKNVFKKLQNYAIMLRETRKDEENKEWHIKLQ